jgi:hypothetical protein
MKVLVISEKDIAAKKIAAHLSDGDADASKMGGVNVYDWKAGKGKAKEEWTVVRINAHKSASKHSHRSTGTKSHESHCVTGKDTGRG